MFPGNPHESSDKRILGIIYDLLVQKSRLGYQSNYPSTSQTGDEILFEVSVWDIAGGSIPSASITAGLYDLDQIDGISVTNIETDTPLGKADGRIFVSRLNDPLVWNIGDIYRMRFKGMQCVIAGKTYYLPDIVMQGRITKEPDIKGTVDNIDTNIGEKTDDPAEEGGVLARLRYLKNRISKGSGTEVDADKSIIDAVGHNGTAELDSGVMKGIEDRVGKTTDGESQDGKILPRLTWAINVLRKGSGTEVADDKSIIDAVGHDGTTDLNTGVTAKIQGVIDSELDDIKSVVDDIDDNVGDKGLGDDLHTKSDTIISDVGDVDTAVTGVQSTADDIEGKADDLLDRGIFVTPGDSDYIDVTGGEQNIVTYTPATPEKINLIKLDLGNLTQDGTWRVYISDEQVQGNAWEHGVSNTNLFIDIDRILTEEIKVSWEPAIAEGADRNIPFSIRGER